MGTVTQKIETNVQFGVDQKPKHEDGTEKRDSKSTKKRMFGRARAFEANYEGSMKLELPEKSNSGDSHKSKRTRAMMRWMHGKNGNHSLRKGWLKSTVSLRQLKLQTEKEKKYFNDVTRNERKKGIGKEELQRHIEEKDTVSALNIKIDSNEDKRLQLSNQILHRQDPEPKIYMQENKNESFFNNAER